MTIFPTIGQIVYGYTSVTNFAPKYGMLTTRTNFRTGPSTSSTIISVLAKGTQVKMIGESNGFYIVQIGTNQVGCLSKSYVITSSTAPVGADTYSKIAATIQTVTASSVNLRRGPGTNFVSNGKLSKGTKVKAIGTIKDFYLVVTEGNTVGMIQKDYISTEGAAGSSGGTTSPTTPTTSLDISQDESYVLKLINEYREKNGKASLTMGVKLLKVARLKAADMTANSYFSHSSPTYGSPFEMMKKYGLTYKAAGENIAGNSSLEAAVNSWINSETHRENLLNGSYNYAGIGISKSNTYGYVIVAMFASV